MNYGTNMQTPGAVPAGAMVPAGTSAGAVPVFVPTGTPVNATTTITTQKPFNWGSFAWGALAGSALLLGVSYAAYKSRYRMGARGFR